MKKIVFLSLALTAIFYSCGNSSPSADTVKDNSYGIWNINYYVDDFGEKTDKGYVSTEIKGKFNNSATTDSDLRVVLSVDTACVYIRFFEYGGTHPVKGRSGDQIDFKIKDSEGNTHRMYSMTVNQDINVLEDSVLMGMLLKGGDIKFIATKSEHGSKSEYFFTLQGDKRLQDAMHEVYGN